MSEYPYEDKIHSDDRVNYKTVYSAEGIKMGKVEAAFSDSFIVNLENEENNMEEIWKAREWLVHSDSSFA
jgi:hypothetical protein